MRTIGQVRTGSAKQKGMSLIELMIAMVVLATGLGALTILFIYSSQSDNKSGKSTSSTMLAQRVLEQISAQHPDSVQVIQMQDCVNNVWNISTVGAAAPVGIGATIDQNAGSLYYGYIDPSQNFAAVPAGYAMRYTDCGGNRQTQYDVRWNIININQYTRLITVSARQISPQNQLGGRMFDIPANLRGIGGM